MSEADGAVVVASDVSKRFGTGDVAVDALRDVSLSLARGRFAAVMGPSGSGKSTLMHILAGLDGPTSGTVTIDGTEITGLGDKQLTLLRRSKIGFVFQSYNLLPMLSAIDNIELPAAIAGQPIDRERERSLMAAVGLEGRRDHRPPEMSGGEQQRVAIARALLSQPAVLFADEPTGNLDSRTSGQILELLRRSCDDYGQSIVMVTHDGRAAAYADRVIFLRDGAVVQDRPSMDAEEIFDVIKSLE